LGSISEQSFSSNILHPVEAPVLVALLLLCGATSLSTLFDGLLFIASGTCCFLPLLLNTCLIGGFCIPSGKCQQK
jgi:hypothetical protein